MKTFILTTDLRGSTALARTAQAALMALPQTADAAYDSESGELRVVTAQPPYRLRRAVVRLGVNVKEIHEAVLKC